MSKKLITKFVDTLTDHICNEMIDHCKDNLNEWGIHPEYINDENIKYWCKGFSNEDFDTLVEECCNDLDFSYRNLMIECIAKECEFIVDDEFSIYIIDCSSFRSLFYKDDYVNYFSYKEFKKLQQIIVEDEDYFLVNEIYDKCMAKIGNVIALADIITLLRY